MAGRYIRDPRVGDNVWYEHRHQIEGKHPNGTITRVNWEDKDVCVVFTDGGHKFFEFDDLYGNWQEERAGGQGIWMLHI